MFSRLSNIGWIKTLILVGSAILLALAAGRASSKHASARKKDDRAEQLLNSGISKEIHKGKKLADAANMDKDKAVVALKQMHDQLDKMGEANEDMDSIADGFNSRRLRKS